MSGDSSVRSVSRERWQEAQTWERELWESSAQRKGWRRFAWPVLRPILRAVGWKRAWGDDWNYWWAERFDHYAFLPEDLGDYIEVGCGPYTNTRLIMRGRSARRVVCSDPLADTYLQLSDRWLSMAHRKGLVEVDNHPIDSLDLAHRLTVAALAEADVDSELVIGVGVGLAAPVDARHGAVHSEGILPDWDAIRPAQELERRLGLPVQIENDANAGAMGEHLFGAGRGVAHMLYLRLSAGVGLGLILGGQLYGGASGIAGEVGHTPVVDDGLICRCGNRGCLETIANTLSLTSLVSRSRGEPVALAQLIALVHAGDRGARRAVADAGTAVGTALAAAINVLNPELVVIGGELAPAGETLLEPIRAAIERRVIAPAASSVRVVPSTLGERAEVTGAAATQLTRAPQALAERLATRG